MLTREDDILHWITVCGPIIASWPVVTLLMFTVLRKPLYAFLEQFYSGKTLQKAKLPGGVELTFARELDTLARSPAATRTIREAPRRELREASEAILTQVDESPGLAIVEGWRLLEAELSAIALRSGLPVAPAVWAMPLVLAALLLDRDLISEDEHVLLKRIKAFRDRVIANAGMQPSVAEARTVVDVSTRLAATFSQRTSTGDHNGGPA